MSNPTTSQYMQTEYSAFRQAEPGVTSSQNNKALFSFKSIVTYSSCLQTYYNIGMHMDRNVTYRYFCD